MLIAGTSVVIVSGFNIFLSSVLNNFLNCFLHTWIFFFLHSIIVTYNYSQEKVSTKNRQKILFVLKIMTCTYSVTSWVEFRYPLKLFIKA